MLIEEHFIIIEHFGLVLQFGKNKHLFSWNNLNNFLPASPPFNVYCISSLKETHVDLWVAITLLDNIAEIVTMIFRWTI